MPINTLQERIESGKPILIAEISPPTSGNAAAVRNITKSYAGRVHALGVSENRGRVRMSALATASLVVDEGVEPILHVITRDRNRIALVSDYLGAKALGIRNMLCTSGTHQTLGQFSSAKNVFDIDSIQLLQMYDRLATDGSAVGEAAIDVGESHCLGGTATPFGDPLTMQVIRTAKKMAAGAQFLVTQPIFDIERFETWWKEISERGFQKEVAIIAGIRLLTDADAARKYAGQRPLPMIPDEVLDQLASADGAAAQRATGIEIALQTIRRLSAFDGLRGFEICGDGDDRAVLEVIEKSELRID